jgi:hypothetical protein
LFWTTKTGVFSLFANKVKEKRIFMKKVLSILMAVLIIVSLAACGNNVAQTPSTEQGSSLWDSATYKEDTTLGEGAKTVVVEVKVEDKSVNFTIKSDAETLGEALLSHNLITGEESEFGLYIKTVNGILADYDVDGSYWGFFKNGEYMMSGVDTTKFSDGEHYELVRTK